MIPESAIIENVEHDSQAAPRSVGTMTLSLANRSTQHTIMIVCVALALLALPLAGTLHCEVAHAANDHAPTPLAESCCMFLCLTGLVGAVVIWQVWVSTTHAALEMTPVRLVSHLARWVPPPRPIDLLP